jgi:glycosyl transferase family 25
MNIYIINLKSAIERKNFQEEQLQKLSLNYQIISATTTDNIAENIYIKHYYDWQRPMRKAEVACYFSHQKLWKRVLKENKPALILEDDALLSKNLPKLLQEVESRNDIDMLNLEVRGRKKFVSKTYENILTSKIYRLYQDRTGAAAYILYPSGAKKLLNCQEKNGIALADAHITNCKMKSYQIEPAMALQLDQCENYGIQNKYLYLEYSSIWQNKYNKSTFLFKIKRIKAQIKLGFKQIWLIIRYQRISVCLIKWDFTQKH